MVGNGVVGRYADRYTTVIMVWGMVILSISLALFAVFAHDKTISVALLVVTGLVGMSMNPAIIARVMKTAHPGPLVNTVHTSVINIGLGAGSWLGGLGIAAGYGLRSPCGSVSHWPCLASSACCPTSGTGRAIRYCRISG